MSVIIPARNEESRVLAVIAAARDCVLIDEVIVVANGCDDGTASVAASAGATVVEVVQPGKGEAVLEGLKHIADDAETILLLDADLTGLVSEHVRDLVLPVVEKQVDMSCGILAGRLWRGSRLPAWPAANFYTLTGQRCLKRDLLTGFPPGDISGYRLEVALNRRCIVESRSVAMKLLSGVGHVTKERKEIPAVRGVVARLKMVASVYATYGRLFARQMVTKDASHRT